MPLINKISDYSPLLNDYEIIITDEDKLAKYVGEIILGNYLHIQKIIDHKNSKTYSQPDRAIDLAINKLKTQQEIFKRDGWVFQIISWIALRIENKGAIFYCQQPHDATAQHGIDGLAVTLNASKEITSIIISEDKCSKNQRGIIRKEVWPEFTSYEKGLYDNKLVSRISAMLANLDDDKIMASINKDAYRTEIRRYRVGINTATKHKDKKGRKKLFLGYNTCVPDKSNKRRTSATLHQDNIRSWMNSFSKKVIQYLESKKTKSV